MEHVDPRKNKMFGMEYAYILDEVFTGEGYEELSDVGKIKVFLRDFVRVKSCEFRTIPNYAKLIGEFLMGLPSGVNIDYYCCAMDELAEKWGKPLRSEEQKDAWHWNFAERMGKRIIEIMYILELKMPRWHIQVLKRDDTTNRFVPGGELMYDSLVKIDGTARIYSNENKAEKFFNHVIWFPLNKMAYGIKEQDIKKVHRGNVSYAFFGENLKLIMYLK